MDTGVFARKDLLIGLALMTMCVCGSPLLASPLTAEFNCVVAGVNSVSCPPAQTSSYGSITLEEIPPHGDILVSTIQVTVALTDPNMKFRDLMLNFDGVGVVTISSDDFQVSLHPDSFSIPPFGGLFDVGSTGTQGWTGGSFYQTVLSGFDTGGGPVALTPDMFDGAETLDVLVHLQNVMSLTAGDSIKVGGGLWDEGGGGGGGEEVPEPAGNALVGGGLVALLWLWRRRRAV